VHQRGGRRRTPKTQLAHLGEPTQAAKAVLRSLARRITALEDEIQTINAQLDHLVGQAAPTLTSRLGIGTSHAAQFLITAGQNADRLGSESAFGRLCGVAPSRFPLAKPTECDCTGEGDCQANRALHLIAVWRLRYDPKTITYMERRRAEGLSKKDVLRCLKRFIAREVFRDLTTDLKHA
jgi:transposase